MIGKIFEITKARFVSHNVYDERLELTATLECGSTFVLLEMQETHNPVDASDVRHIFKMKILTNEGKVGYAVFWEDEIQPAKTS